MRTPVVFRAMRLIGNRVRPSSVSEFVDEHLDFKPDDFQRRVLDSLFTEEGNHARALSLGATRFRRRPSDRYDLDHLLPRGTLTTALPLSPKDLEEAKRRFRESVRHGRIHESSPMMITSTPRRSGYSAFAAPRDGALRDSRDLSYIKWGPDGGEDLGFHRFWLDEWRAREHDLRMGLAAMRHEGAAQLQAARLHLKTRVDAIWADLQLDPAAETQFVRGDN